MSVKNPDVRNTKIKARLEGLGSRCPYCNGDCRTPNARKACKLRHQKGKKK